MDCPVCSNSLPIWKSLPGIIFQGYVCKFCGTILTIKTNFLLLSACMFMSYLFGIIGIISYFLNNWIILFVSTTITMIVFLVLAYYSFSLVSRDAGEHRIKYDMVIYLLMIIFIVLFSISNESQKTIDHMLYAGANFVDDNTVNFSTLQIKVPFYYMQNVTNLGSLNLYTFSSNEFISIRHVYEQRDYGKIFAQLGYAPIYLDWILFQDEKIFFNWVLEKSDTSRCEAIIYLPKENIEITFRGEKDRLNEFKIFVSNINVIERNRGSLNSS